MAAVSAAGDEIVQFELNHYICGYHDYMDIWTPYIRETLSLHCEPSNSKDPYAVAVMSSDNEVVGNIPVLFSRVFYIFLQRHGHNGCCEITGERINHGIGVGLEIPCIYRLSGKQLYINKLSIIANKLVVTV